MQNAKRKINSSLNTTLLGIFFALFFIPVSLSAQTLPSSGEISMEASPEIPRPFETISLELKSFAVDLNRAQITWLVNGERQNSGLGRTRFSVSVGGIGETTVIRALIDTASDPIVIEKIFIPGEVDMLWEVWDAYTPPFYKGKALPTFQNVVRVVALPHMVSGGTQVVKESAVYKWKRNNKFRDFSSRSGYGQYFVTFLSDIVRTKELIEVDVSSLSNTLFAQGVFLLERFDPEVLLYENHPLLGIRYNHALTDSASLQNNELVVTAEPYFFSTQSRDVGVKYNWSINNRSVPPEEDGTSEVVFRNESSGSGNARIGVTLTHPDRLLQRASNSFRIVFGETRGGFFGF